MRKKCDKKGCKEKVMHDIELDLVSGRLITSYCDKHWQLFKKKYNIPCPH